MKQEILFKNNWSEEDKAFFLKHYLPNTRWFDRILLAVGCFVIIAIIFGVVEMHKKLFDFTLAYILAALLILNYFFTNTINKRLLEKRIHKHPSVVLKASGLDVDGTLYQVERAVISHQFIFFCIGRRTLIQRITDAEAADVSAFVREQKPFSISQTSKTFTITKFALRKGVY